MMKKHKRKEKICLFFASDYHFEMISLPYINENLKKNKNSVSLSCTYTSLNEGGNDYTFREYE